MDRLTEVDQVVAQTSQKRVEIDNSGFLDSRFTPGKSDHGFRHRLHFVDRAEHPLLGFRIIDELRPANFQRIEDLLYRDIEYDAAGLKMRKLKYTQNIYQEILGN